MKLAEEATIIFGLATQPGKFLVDTFPIRKDFHHLEATRTQVYNSSKTCAIVDPWRRIQETWCAVARKSYAERQRAVRKSQDRHGAPLHWENMLALERVLILLSFQAAGTQKSSLVSNILENPIPGSTEEILKWMSASLCQR